MEIKKPQFKELHTELVIFLPHENHFENDAKLNSFLIDPDYITENLSKDQYRINSDGSIDLDITLYFRPQSFFYLGLIISGLTLFGCVGYLGYEWGRRRKKNSKYQIPNNK